MALDKRGAVGLDAFMRTPRFLTAVLGLFLLVTIGAQAAGTVSFKTDEITVSQEAGAVLVTVVYSGTPTKSGFTDAFITSIDGTAIEEKDFESINGTFGSGIAVDFAETQQERTIPIKITLTKSRLTKFFNLVLAGYNGSTAGTPSTLKVTVLGWTPPKQLLNRLETLRKQLKAAQRISDPVVRAKTTKRLKRQINEVLALLK